MINVSTVKPATLLIQQWQNGNDDALGKLTHLLYDELRKLAGFYLRSENNGHTLQATSLVHETYLRLIDSENQWDNRYHFYSVAAKVMRQILVDHARAKKSLKRGGDIEKVPLYEDAVTGTNHSVDLLSLHDCIEKLQAFDEKKAELVQLHYFSGLNYDELSSVLSVSRATIFRELRLSKAWLFQTMQQEV